MRKCRAFKDLVMLAVDRSDHSTAGSVRDRPRAGEGPYGRPLRDAELSRRPDRAMAAIPV